MIDPDRLDRLKSRAQLAQEARYVLWHMGQKGGQRPEDVMTHAFLSFLLQAFDAANDEQAARLALAYPDYRMFLHIARTGPDGPANLLAMAEAWEASRR